MGRRLIVSAHLDDALLSAWHGIAGHPATVVTVFAGVPKTSVAPAWDRACGYDDSTELMTRRRIEDAEAVESLGGRTVHLDFLDHQYRDEPAPRQAILDALVALLTEGDRGDDTDCPDYDEVWLPAGIGGHPDHQIAGEAALAASPGLRRVMYVDLPYASSAWTGPVASLERDVASEESWTQALLRSSPMAPPRTPTPYRLSKQESASKRAALAHYGTQLALLTRTFPDWWRDPRWLEREWVWELPPSKARVSPLLQLPIGLRDPLSGDGRGTFLSVITRTEGRRPQELAEVLDSLAGQSNRDFELLVVAHNANDPERSQVREQLDRLPAWLKDRSSLLEAEGGTRSRPLNVGLECATGRYVAVLDDDDVALPTWVEEFARLETRSPGMILRARVVRTVDGRELDLYPESFDLIDHLAGNRSPVCGLAYPRQWLAALGLMFDESVEVLEDWDLLLQAAPLCGVAASAAVTSHYRDNSGKDSSSRHSQLVWEFAERTVIDKADRNPIVLPPGSVQRLRACLQRLGALEARLPQAEADVEAARRELARVTDALADLQHHYDALALDHAAVVADFRGSRSWRMTAPLRWAGTASRRVRTLAGGGTRHASANGRPASDGKAPDRRGPRRT
jgi:LmbE family N-acetylglucosaminyl deacetylase